MRVIEVNMVANGSTGNIMLNIAKILKSQNDEVKTFSCRIYSKLSESFGFVSEDHTYIGSRFENRIHVLLGQFTGLNGLYSWFGTQKLINECKKFKPNVIHIHNLHNFCFCFPMFFRYVKKYNIPVVWTLHDCWAFTGHCPHFVEAKCDKWKDGCGKCPQLSCYPKSRVDATSLSYKLKRKWFTQVDNLTIVTPSKWLKSLVHKSFLKEYPVKVINNGIDLSVFKPTESNFREKYNISGDKRIILGVSSAWGIKKGLDVFVELATRLDKNKYQIVLVGTNESIDKNLPDNIISIHRTDSQKELAEIYTASDLFVNPTREDTFPTVNIEALACGIPVLTFKTGGSPEILDEKCGLVVPCDDIDAMEREIIRICTDNPYSKEDCINRAKNFDMNEKFKEYVELYEQVKG